jgi:hypothetical protein
MDNSMAAADLLGVTCGSTLVVPYDAALADSLVSRNANIGDAVRGGFAVRWMAGAGWCGECQASGDSPSARVLLVAVYAVQT